MGICSGFHVLCSGSEETERGYSGFGVFDLDVTRLRSLDNGKPTTHNSWRVISQPGEVEKRMYFNHSFAVGSQDGNNIETLFFERSRKYKYSGGNRKYYRGSVSSREKRKGRFKLFKQILFGSCEDC